MEGKLIPNTTFRVRNSPTKSHDGGESLPPSRFWNQKPPRIKTIPNHKRVRMSVSPVSLQARKTYMYRKRKPFIRTHGRVTNRLSKNLPHD
jgi:hypothetical protein